MSNNLNAILWLLCLVMMQLTIVLPSDPKELDRELRKIVKPTIAAVNFVLNPLTNHSIVLKDPPQKPNRTIIKNQRGQNTQASTFTSPYNLTADSERVRAPHSVYHRPNGCRKETVSRLPYLQEKQLTRADERPFSMSTKTRT